MKQMIRNWILGGALLLGIGGSMIGLTTPQQVSAQGVGGAVGGASSCNERLLTFPAWYRGLLNGNCDIEKPGSGTQGLSTFIWTIVLNVVELLLQIVGYVAVAFIIVGGFKFLTSAGSPDGIAKSRKTIMNAVIGLVISLFSVGIVNAVVGAL